MQILESLGLVQKPGTKPIHTLHTPPRLEIIQVWSSQQIKTKSCISMGIYNKFKPITYF
jgi:hypothetical protein